MSGLVKLARVIVSAAIVGAAWREVLLALGLVAGLYGVLLLFSQ